MRVNRYIALATGISRRAADKLADAGEISVNGRNIKAGQEVTDTDIVTVRGKKVKLPKFQTIILNKPKGFVCSRSGQGSKTIYDLLPEKYHHLKPVGRLDKDSSGLLLMTNDGDLAQKLTHPSYHKIKRYELSLDMALKPHDREQITKKGVVLDDGRSKFDLDPLGKNDQRKWLATLYEGRNRQIRRTFEALGYKVTNLRRVIFGDYRLGKLEPGEFITT